MLKTLALLTMMALPGASLACSAMPGSGEGLSAINAARAGAGAQSLSVSNKLTSVAQAYACDMIARGYFSHKTPEGQGFQARLRAAGLPGGCGAENIAFTGAGGGVGQALSQWKGSAPHKRNMLGRKYQVAALAGAQGNGKTIWVLILGNCR
jgi:uncharacterized protein YkwD